MKRLGEFREPYGNSMLIAKIIYHQLMYNNARAAKIEYLWIVLARNCVKTKVVFDTFEGFTKIVKTFNSEMREAKRLMFIIVEHLLLKPHF